jgi:hypothetical protein
MPGEASGPGAPADPEWDVVIRFANARVSQDAPFRVAAPDAATAAAKAARQGARAHGRMIAVETVSVVPVPHRRPGG